MIEPAPLNVARTERLKVLVSAYACEPERGSEPGFGWTWVREIALQQECWVVTRSNNRAAIERYLIRNPMPYVHFVYYDLPVWTRFWKKGSRGVRTYYYLWQIGAYQLAHQLNRSLKFDLVHHLTFGSYWLPSFFALLPVPFVWGPVGGGESAPPAFLKSFGFRGRVFEFLRDASRRLREFDPSLRMTARRAVVSIATTPETAARMRALGCRDVMISVQFAWSSDELDKIVKRRASIERPFRVVSVGRMIHWKGFALGLRAFAKFHREFPKSEYWLMGSGTEKKRLQMLATELGIADSVVFCGSLPRAATLEKMSDCDVLLHPALHDACPWVIVEAMGVGLPVICFDLGGPAVQVSNSSGIRIRAVTPEQAIRDFTAALALLAQNPAKCAEFGDGARARAEQEFNWQHKKEFLAGIYGRVTNRQTLCEAHDGK